MKSAHLLAVCRVGAIFTITLGNFCGFGTRPAHEGGLIYIYIYAVKLKSGPIFALFKVKKWSNLFVFFVFFVFKNLVLPAERRGFLKNKPKKKQQKKNTIFKLKSGPIMLRNIIGPLFNFNLAHFLTLEFSFFFFCFFCFCFWLKPLFL